MAVLATGTREANTPPYQEMPHLPVLIDEDGAVRARLGTSATPSAVLIGTDRRPVGAVASGERLIRRLLVGAPHRARPRRRGRQRRRDTPPRPAEGVGKPADELQLTDVVSPADGVVRHLNGEATILLDMSTGATVLLDQIGALVWSVLDGVSPLRRDRRPTWQRCSRRRSRRWGPTCWSSSAPSAGAACSPACRRPGTRRASQVPVATG